jgi:Fe-S-cluster containining protein
MTIHLDGIGEDWVVTRRPGGKPELNSYATLGELQKILQRALDKAKASGPAPKPRPVIAKYEAPLVPKNGVSADSVRLEAPPFDCTICGACCVGEGKAHVLLGRGERARIGRQLPIVRRAKGEYLRTRKNSDGVTVCAALDGTVGSECKCSIYENRPMVCQLYEVGGESCLKAREILKIKA